MSVPNGVAAIGLLGWDTNCGNLGRIIVIVIIVILVPVSKRPKQGLYFNLMGGCHNFQYFDHKSSWHWDWWENVKKKKL